MIRRGVKLQLVIFLLISAAGISYLGANYVGLGRVLFNPRYTVTADLTASGGIFTGADVTYRGVGVGRVGDLHLTPGGVAADLQIDHDVQIPADTKAVVRNLSAVGEQYVDLLPQSDHRPYLHDGSTIAQADTDIPITTNKLLLDLDQFVNSVPREQLGTLIEALGTAFRNTGPDLARLIDRGDSLTKAVTDALPQTRQLIDASKTVLDTQRLTADDLTRFSQALAQLSGTVVDIDPSIRATLDNGILASQQLEQLLAANEAAIPVLLGNLVLAGQIQVARLPALNQIFMLYPAIISNGFGVTPGDGTAHFGLQLTPGGGPCTNGYQGTDRRPGTDTSFKPANLGAYCNEPHNSAITARGARNAPRPIGDDTAGPQGLDPRNAYRPQYGSGAVPADPDYSTSVTNSDGSPKSPAGATAPASTSSAAPTVRSASYDPLTGRIVAGSDPGLTIGSTGGQQRAFGKDSWQWLLLGPLSG